MTLRDRIAHILETELFPLYQKRTGFNFRDVISSGDFATDLAAALKGPLGQLNGDEFGSMADPFEAQALPTLSGKLREFDIAGTYTAATDREALIAARAHLAVIRSLLPDADAPAVVEASTEE